jgi:hypothetical protein
VAGSGFSDALGKAAVPIEPQVGGKPGGDGEKTVQRGCIILHPVDLQNISQKV